MVLYENSVIKLEYNPATDILEIEYPDLHDYLIPEIRNSIDRLLETVRNYDVKRVLLDSSNTYIGVEQEQSKEITLYLASGLVQTRVQKLARVQSLSENVEQTAQGNISHINSFLALPFQLQNFSSKSEALAWLVKD